MHKLHAPSSVSRRASALAQGLKITKRFRCSVKERDGKHCYLPAGITGVKVDCQAGVGLIGSAMGGGPAVAQQYHIALEDSIKKHFPGNDCINCMCHSTENFYRQVPNNFTGVPADARYLLGALKPCYGRQHSLTQHCGSRNPL